MSVIYIPKWMIILNLINKGYNSSMTARKGNITQGYTIKVIRKFEKEGLIITKKEGRNNKFKLTSKGVDIHITVELLLKEVAKCSL